LWHGYGISLSRLEQGRALLQCDCDDKAGDQKEQFYADPEFADGEDRIPIVERKVMGIGAAVVVPNNDHYDRHSTQAIKKFNSAASGAV
jgi:hypothetical protein